MSKTENLIVHLTSSASWELAQQEGKYSAASLEKEGFIHCSQPDQVVEVAERYYSGGKGMLLLWIDTKQVPCEIRWEPSDQGIYPHVYGPIPLEAIISVERFEAFADS